MSKKGNFFEILVLFILSLTPILWLKEGEIILGHDSGFRLNPLRHLVNLFYSWDPSSNFGLDWSILKGFLVTQAPEAFFTLLTKSVSLGQTLTFIFWFFMIGLSMYIFINSFFKEEKYWLFRIFTSIFYMYNFLFLQAWFIAERAKFSLVAALPLGILLIYKVMSRECRLIKGTILFSFLFFFLNGGGNPSLYGFILVTYGVSFIYLTIINWRVNGIKEILFTLKVMLGFFFGFVGVNAYWFLPQIFLYSRAYESVTGSLGGPKGVLGWESVVNRNTSFINLVRLQGIPDWYSNVLHAFSNTYIYNPLLIVASFIPIFVISFGLFYNQEPIKERKIKVFFYLVLVIFLFTLLFTAGSQPPLGFIYSFMVEHVPGFAIFRSALYKFGPGFWFSFILLVSFCLSYLLLKSVKKNILYTFLGLISILLLLFYHYPFFVKNFFLWNPPFSTKIKVPNYVSRMANYLDRLPPTTRTLLLPSLDEQFKVDSYTWQYFSLDLVLRLFTDKSIVADQSFSQGIITSTYRSLLENNEKIFERLIGLAGINKILWRDDVLYADKVTDKKTYSYLEKRLTEFKGVNLEKGDGPWRLYSINSPYYSNLFYTPETLIYAESKHTLLRGLLEKTNEKIQPVILFSTSLVGKDKKVISFASNHILEVNCIVCLSGEEERLGQAYVSLLPDSPFYFLVSSKEQKTLSQYQNDPVKMIDADLGFGGKRLEEIKQITERDLRSNSEDLIRENIKRYEKLIDDAIKQSSRLPEERQNAALVKISSYLGGQFNIFQSLINRYNLASKDLEDLSLFIQGKVNELENKIWITSPDRDQIRYMVTVVSPGFYEINIADTRVLPKKVIVDGQEVSDLKHYYFTAGAHKLNLIYPNLENLLGVDTTEPKEFDLNFGKKTYLEIKNYNNQDIYNVSLEYRVIEGKPLMTFVEEGELMQKGELIKNKKGYSLVYNQTWNSTRDVFKPTINSKKAYLELYSGGFDLSGAKILIKNLKVTKVYTPKVFLSKSLTPPPLDTPKITFERINPTKYLVHIKEAKSSYLLIFENAYNQEWKAYVLKPKQENIEILEKNHYEVNTYANAWLIEQKGNYDLLIEYYPQRVFYFGLMITGASIFILLFLSVFLLKKKI